MKDILTIHNKFNKNKKKKSIQDFLKKKYMILNLF
jgi:hypothetical protein